MFDFTRRLNAPSMIRYACWRLAADRESCVDLTLRDGTRFRHSSVDYGCAYEVFVQEIYKPGGTTRETDVRLVVDLGANVGFTALYFLRSYPLAHLLAFEPHPRHIERFRANMALNRMDDRVTLYSAAAGNRAGIVRLSDLGTSSTVKTHGSQRLLDVKALDVFEVLGNRRIDLLKMDIEGSEYDILADDRFLAMDVGTIVMEWHRNESLADEHGWLADRLTGAGYEIEDIFAQPHLGMLWAHRKNAN